MPWIDPKTKKKSKEPATIERLFPNTGTDASDDQDNRHGGILASAPPEDDGDEDRDDP
eukprot:COSAG02_NODE_62330_length_266_cov_0.616766_1_plen_58_part_00